MEQREPSVWDKYYYSGDTRSCNSSCYCLSVSLLAIAVGIYYLIWKYDVPDFNAAFSGRSAPMYMAVIFEFIVRALIVIGIVGIFSFFVGLLRREYNLTEKVILCVASLTGFLIYLGAKTLGLSMPDLMFSAISMSNSLVFSLWVIAIPVGSGVLVAWYTIATINRNSLVAQRFLFLLVTFIIVMFSDIYATTAMIDIQRSEDMKALLPNLTFTVALALYVIFQYKPKQAITPIEEANNFNDDTTANDVANRTTRSRRSTR